MDLLRVISHHRARLATPIRTVQKIYSDADLENVPFAESIYSRGVSNRPLLLIEPSYKINGEDKTKNRGARPNGERDGKTARPSSDSKVDAKVGAAPASDSKTKETPTSDNKGEAKAGVARNSDAKAATASTSDPKISDKVAAKSASKTDSKVTEADSESDNGAVGTLLDTSTLKNPNSKQPKSVGNQKNTNNSTSSASETGAEKSGGFSTASQAKPESERLPVPKPPMSKPVLEENIVLGVALEGSKRTLPIEEDMYSPPSHAEVTELATRCNGQGSPTPDKDKKDGHIPPSPSSTSVDQ